MISRRHLDRLDVQRLIAGQLLTSSVGPRPVAHGVIAVLLALVFSVVLIVLLVVLVAAAPFAAVVWLTSLTSGLTSPDVATGAVCWAPIENQDGSAAKICPVIETQAQGHGVWIHYCRGQERRANPDGYVELSGHYAWKPENLPSRTSDPGFVSTESLTSPSGELNPTDRSCLGIQR